MFDGDKVDKDKNMNSIINTSKQDALIENQKCIPMASTHDERKNITAPSHLSIIFWWQHGGQLSFVGGSFSYCLSQNNFDDKNKDIYRYKVTPFWLKIIGATYHRAMQKNFDDIFDEQVHYYGCEQCSFLAVNVSGARRIWWRFPFFYLASYSRWLSSRSAFTMWCPAFCLGEGENKAGTRAIRILLMVTCLRQWRHRAWLEALEVDL